MRKAVIMGLATNGLPAITASGNLIVAVVTTPEGDFHGRDERGRSIFYAKQEKRRHHAWRIARPEYAAVLPGTLWYGSRGGRATGASVLPGIAQTDAFYYPFVALVFMFLAGLLILASLLALRVHWLLVSGVFLLSLLPLGIALLPFRKTGFPTAISLWTTNWFLTYGCVMVGLSLILLVRVKRVWPVLWRTGLVTAGGAALAIALLLVRGPTDWGSSTLLPVFSLLSLLGGGVLIFLVVFWITRRGREPG